MGRRFRLLVAGAAALVVGAVFLLYAHGVRSEVERQRSEMLARYGGEVVDLVVAQRALEPGDVVAADDIEVREWLADMAPVDAMTNADDAVGATVTEPAAEGSPLTALNFRDASESADVPSGYVAITLPLTADLGMPADISVGADVVGYRVGDGSSEVVAADMVVLSVPATTSTLSSSAQTVSVAVRPEEVSVVLAAQVAGELRVVIPAEDVDSIPDAQAQQAPATVEPVEGQE